MPRAIAISFSFSSSYLFIMTFFNIRNLLLLLLAIDSSWHYHLAHWHIFLSGSLLVVLASICVSIVWGAPIILLKILFIVLEACKTITKKRAEGLHTRLTLGPIWLLGQFTDTNLLGAAVDLWNLLLRDVRGSAIIRILRLLILNLLERRHFIIHNLLVCFS